LVDNFVSEQKTHRVRKSPQISARDLADYMEASEQARRTIVRGSKFVSTARAMQHDEAKSTVSKFIRNGDLTFHGWTKRRRVSEIGWRIPRLIETYTTTMPITSLGSPMYGLR
jgi:hypothetical protein